MKLIKSIILIAIVCTVVGCSDDNENEKLVNTAEITGDWKLTLVDSSEGMARISSGEQTAEASILVSSKNESANLSLSKNPNLIESYGGFTQVFTLKQGDQVVSTFEQIIENMYYGLGSWTFADTSVITFLPEEQSLGIELSFEVVELTEKRLVLKQIFEQPLVISGYEVDASATIFYHFTK